MDANKSESSSRSEKLVGFFSYILRGTGCLFLLLGVAMTISGIRLLLHPDSTVNFNGVETTAIGPKLFVMFFPLPCSAFGFFLALRFERVLKQAFLQPAISPLGDQRDAVHASAMSPRTIKLSWWDPKGRGSRYFFGAVGVALAAAVWLALRHWLTGVVCSLFVLVGFGMLTEEYTLIDAGTRRVAREFRLFGLCRFWLRSRPLSEFTAVVMERKYGKSYIISDIVWVGDDNDDDSVCVCLQWQNGRLMRIRYFSFVRPGQRCVEAEKLAQSLAELTGLPLPRRSSLEP